MERFADSAWGLCSHGSVRILAVLLYVTAVSLVGASQDDYLPVEQGAAYPQMPVTSDLSNAPRVSGQFLAGGSPYGSRPLGIPSMGLQMVPVMTSPSGGAQLPGQGPPGQGQPQQQQLPQPPPIPVPAAGQQQSFRPRYSPQPPQIGLGWAGYPAYGSPTEEQEPAPNLVGYVPHGPQSPALPVNYNYGNGGFSGVLYARDSGAGALKELREGVEEEETYDPLEEQSIAATSVEEDSKGRSRSRSAAKSRPSKQVEEFGLPYDLPSDLEDVDRYVPRIDPFLPQPADFRSQSLENAESLRNPSPKGKNSLTCYKCGHACNNRVGVPVICNSPLEQCVTYYDPQTLEVTCRGCRLGPPGCFVSDDGKYGCLCSTYLCNNYKMFKRLVGSKIPKRP